MMFIEYGYNIKNPIPVDTLLKQLRVSRTEKSKSPHTVKPKKYQQDSHGQETGSRDTRSPEDAYQEIERIDQDKPVLHAKQIMSSPVVCLNTEMSIADALVLFKNQTYRHMPVLTKDNELTGIVSDRDLLQYSSMLSETRNNLSNPINNIMSTPVLTASIETDVRYIAKLFVLEHIGAMPVMSEGKLTGIITRSDIMRAVMHHFNMELWV